MRRIGKSVVSMLMAVTLSVSMVTPTYSVNVYAAEAGTSGETGQSTTTYEVQFKDKDKEIQSLTLSKGKELNLTDYIKIVKTEGENTGLLTDEEVQKGTFSYKAASDNLLTITKDGKVSWKETATEKKATVTVQWQSGEGNPAITAEGKIDIELASVPVERIAIQEDGNPITEKTLALGDTYDLASRITVLPENADKNLTYTVQTVSENKDIVKVDKKTGKITTENLGDAKVAVTDADSNVSASITIHVVDVPVGLQLEPEKYSMKVGDEPYQIKTKLVYASKKTEDLDATKLTYTSDNDKIAIVDQEGKVTAVKQDAYPATAHITVSYKTSCMVGNESKDYTWEKIFTITVDKTPIEKLTIKNKPAAGNWKINDTYQLEVELSPEGAASSDVLYKSSNKDVATVSSTGKITATGISKDPVTITAYARNNKEIKDTIQIKVYQTTFNVTELGVDGTDQKDDATELNKILKYATSADEMINVIIPDGTYYIGSALKVWTETNIQLSANAVIKRLPSAEGKSMIVNRTSTNNGGYTAAHDITISGGTWDGNTTGTDHSNLLYFGHAKNVTIKNTTIKNDSGAHLIEFSGVQNAVVENVTLTGFVMSKNLTASQNTAKEAIQIDHCSGETNAPGMEPFDGTACDGVTIRNCNITNYMAGIGTHTQGNYASKNILIENNTFDNITNACLNLRKFENVTVRNNTANNCTTFVYATESQGLIENNYANNGTTYVPVANSGLRAKNGITISNRSNFVIQNNTIQNAVSNGICVWNGSTADIHNNKIYKNLLYGIRTQGSTVTLKKNTFSQNKKGVYDTYKDATIKSSDDIRSYYINIKAKYKYKGKAVKPKITIKGLKKKYYKVTYKNYKKPGTATVIIKGKKGVKKTLKIKYKISKK
ncbi:MAG: right-handed parallel beta-helix repeat-containing protein [Lachnospiraceae bacterium]|nr:right-handed parallel beta-helix repeat-containing protein [Lachnospiraceae bacterium]